MIYIFSFNRKFLFFNITFVVFDKKRGKIKMLLLSNIWHCVVGVPVVCPCTGEVYIAADFKFSFGSISD